MTIKNLDKYLDPPDEPEAEICETCGGEKTILDDFGGQRYQECTNEFCPDRHSGINKRMAEELVEQRENTEFLKRKIHKLFMALHELDPQHISNIWRYYK